MIEFPYRTGAIPSEPDTRDYPVAMRLANEPLPASTLPSAFRLTKMPKVLTQVRGSCMAATPTAFAMKSEFDEAGVTLTPDFELWYDELAVEQFGVQNDIGLMVRPTLDSMLEKGPPLPGDVGRREHSRLEAYYSVPDLVSARRVIYELRRPVLVVHNIPYSWASTTPVGQLAPIGSAWVGPHAWLMWGWDDRPTLGNLIRSSWSTQYGVNGSCYMTKEQWGQTFVEAWHLESAR
jgi:hypothetical protein